MKNRSWAFALGILVWATPGVQAKEVPLKVRLSASQTTLHLKHRPTLQLEFINSGRKSVTLVKPGDGSEHGWRTPVVRWTVEKNGDDITQRLGGRCGNIGSLQHSDVFVLKPGESQIIPLAYYTGQRFFDAPGRYTLRFSYRNQPNIKWVGLAFHSPGAMKRARKSTPCVLESNALTFTVKK